VNGVRGQENDVLIRRDNIDSRHTARESAEQRDIHPDPPSSDISTVPYSMRHTLFIFSSMSFLHSSGTHVWTKLPSVSRPNPERMKGTHEAKFIFGFPSTISTHV
jgi:hypothetical protein